MTPIARVGKLVGDHAGALERIFTPGERGFCDAVGGRRRDARYAAAFAAKEAVMKALGTGWRADVEWWSRHIPKEFGPAPEGGYVALPVVACGECVMILYADTFARQSFAEDLRALEILARHVGVLLENQRLRRGRGEPPALNPSTLAATLKGRGARAV